MQEFLLFVALSQSGACKTVSRLADTNEPLRNIDRKMFIIDRDMPSKKMATARGLVAPSMRLVGQWPRRGDKIRQSKSLWYAKILLT
jgi:hypothetical protein